MTARLRLLLRVIRRRLGGGEALSGIWEDYPKLTETERALLWEQLGE